MAWPLQHWYIRLPLSPGGASVAALVRLGPALHWVNETYAHCKMLGGLGAWAFPLSARDIPEVEGEGVQSHPGVVTAPPDVFGEFMDAFLAAVAAHRHWEREDPAAGVPA